MSRETKITVSIFIAFVFKEVWAEINVMILQGSV
jgi:hypothetical protein